VTETVESYRRILRSSSLIGGASVAAILIAIFRIKVLAMLVGPEGVGVVGLYIGLISTAAALATMGLGSAGTRQVAEAAAMEDPHAPAVARRALTWGTIILAVAGTFAVWALRERLAVLVLGSATHADTVGWLSIAVGFSVAGASQGALLQGMRRIREIAALNVLGAAAATAVGLAFVWIWGASGLVAYVIAGPAAGFLLGQFYVSRLPSLRASVRPAEIRRQWNALARLGIAFMGAGLAASLVQLWMRIAVGDALGMAAIGHFQASWTISSQYLGFVLGAMAADYYPRLTGSIGDRAAAVRLVNQQAEAALLLAGPVFVAMMALAPWIVELLYAPAFAPAASVLRWQILGDVLKVASWPLGFVILAAGDGRTFFWTEAAAFGLMGTIVAVFTPALGIQGAGVAYLAMYALYLPLIYVLARRRIDFRWSGAVVQVAVITFLACAGVAALAAITPWATAIGCMAAAGFAMYSLAHLSRMAGMLERLGRLGLAAERLMARIGIAHGPGKE
jgi:PST family polysaccharide transporter